MPMIDVYAAEGTFTDTHTLAQNLAQAVMRWEQVSEIPLFSDNPAGFTTTSPPKESRTPRARPVTFAVQVLPVGILDRDKQRGVVRS
jgi:hypothetical protein